MVFAERNLWSSTVVSVVGVSVYVLLLLRQESEGGLTAVDWPPLMLWTIGASIVATIVVSIAWGIAVGLRDPAGASESDERDRAFGRMGDRVGHAVLIVAGLGVIVLSALEADLFWIAQTMVIGFALSSVVGGVAGLAAYRKGLA